MNTKMITKRPLLEICGLDLTYPSNGAGRSVPHHVLRRVSLNVGEGDSFGIVGESGCGKTTLGKGILRLIPPREGRVEMAGVDIASLGARELNRTRGDMQMVFQDPYGSLNPRHTIGRSIAEPLSLKGIENSSESSNLVGEALEEVGLDAFGCLEISP